MFGCGGNRDADKRPKMGHIAARLADWAIMTDDNPRTEDPALIRAQIRGSWPLEEIADRAEAIRTAIDRLSKDDILLVAGKGCESVQVVGTEAFPFCDIDVVRQALGAVGT